MQKQKSKTGPFFVPIKKLFERQNKPMLHTIEWIFVLLAFFFIGLAVIYRQTYNAYYNAPDGKYLQSMDALIQTSEDQEMFTGEVVLETIDTANWDTYQNKWYGFEIQHPDSWKNNTQYKTATEKSAVYETIYKFRKNGEDEDEAFVGYDVKIYSAKKVQGIEKTNDIHAKEGAPEDKSECPVMAEEMNFGPEGDYFQKVSIKEGNPCFEPAYFFSIAKGDYIYNIVPAIGESGERFAQPEKETTKLFPEYKEAIAVFNFIPIVRPKPKPDPRIGVKRPVSAKIVNGKLVCAKKNDKPKKSKKNKPGHLDLECCLDPDETPNPWCTY